MDANTQKASYRYKLEQTEKGVKITLVGDAIEEIAADYIHLRMRLEQEGIKIVSDKG